MASITGVTFNKEEMHMKLFKNFLKQNCPGFSMADEADIPSQLALLEPATRMKKLVDVSDSTAFSLDVPLERYLKSMLQMRKMALGYIQDAATQPQSVEKALVLLLRFCRFAMKDIPSHPQYAVFSGPEKNEVFQILEDTLKLAERVKENVRQTFQMDYDSALSYLNKQKAEEEKKREKERQLEMEREQKEKNERALQEIQQRKRKAAEIADPGVGTAQISFSAFSPVPDAPGPSKATAPIRSYPEAELNAPSTSRGSAALSTNSTVPGKTIQIAYDVIEEFLKAAAVNTINNVETCGILCGQQKENQFLVTHVIVPKQRGTADTCYAEGEVELLEVQRKNDLLTAGWIHTHPSQTAFLSSVDLHMHFAYQTSMNDAVAIVCAPTHKKVGTYVLTQEGMRIIGACRRREFHEHPEATGPLFSEASHVCYVKTLKASLIDLRAVTS